MGLSLNDAKRVGLAHLHPSSAPASQSAIAKVVPPAEDAMNGTERKYTLLLEQRKRIGAIQRWDFEPVKLRLADKTFYAPDFRVILANGVEEYHEVKGFWRDDARVKIKLAAELHPYRFVAVSLVKGEWRYEEFQGKRR